MSDDWVKVCARDELLPGEFKVVWDGDTATAVYNLEGDLYAIEDTCTHDGGELAGGDICGCEVVCPRHGARFRGHKKTTIASGIFVFHDRPVRSDSREKSGHGRPFWRR